MRKFLLIATLLFAHSAAAENGATLPVQLTTSNRMVPLTLEYATNPASREYGLMNRTRLGSDGMIFVFPHTANLSFWMKNTKIPLDMLFVDEHGVIVHVHVNAVPESLTPIDSGKPVKSVIELGGGQAQALHIREGDRVSYALPDTTHVE